MNKFIALLGGLTLVGVVACDEGKPAVEKKVEKTAMKVENTAASKPAKDDHAHKAGGGHADAKKEMDPAAKEAAATEAYAAKILTNDYDAEALKEISDANAEAELKALEAAINSK